MSSLKFIHTADLHVGASKFLGPEYLERQFGVYDAIIDLAVSRGINTIVVAGDIFDTDEPEEHEKELFLERLLAWDAMGIRILAIRGNHDQSNMQGASAIRYLAHMSDHGVFNHVFAERTQYVRVGDTIFMLLCHKPRYFRDDFYGAIRALKTSTLIPEHKYCVAVVHECLKGSISDTNWRMKDGVDVPLVEAAETVPEHDLTYIAIGDIHICFPDKVQVMIDYDKCCTIKEVVSNPNITHVLSYNLEEKRIERRLVTERRQSKYTGKYTTLTLSDGSTIKSTSDHKYVVVGKGDTPAKDIQSGDRLIQYAGDFSRVYTCQHCTEMFSTSGEMKAHRLNSTCSMKKLSCDHCDQTFESLGAKGNHVTAHHTPTYLTKCEECGAMFSNIGAHQYYHDHVVADKRAKSISVSLREGYYKSDAGIEKKLRTRARWLREKYWTKSQCMSRSGTKSKGELFVEGCDIENLKFTGHGDFWVALLRHDGTYRNKNPDFVLGNPADRSSVKKVVEVFGGMGYFHNEEEMVSLRKEYLSAGIEALIIDDRRLSKESGRLEVKAELEAFCNNHYITISKIDTYTHNKGTESLVYSIEVEENHNFFVVAGDYAARNCIVARTPVLVKNCQRMGPRAFYSGAPMQVKFGDQERKGVLIVDTEDPGNPEFVQITSKRLIKVVADSLEDFATKPKPEDAHVKMVASPKVFKEAVEAGLADGITRFEAVRDTKALDYKSQLDLPSKVLHGLSQHLTGEDLELAKREAASLFSQVNL